MYDLKKDRETLTHIDLHGHTHLFTEKNVEKPQTLTSKSFLNPFIYSYFQSHAALCVRVCIRRAEIPTLNCAQFKGLTVVNKTERFLLCINQ